MVAAAPKVPDRCIPRASSPRKTSARTLSLTAAYSGESLGLGDLGTAPTGNPARTGSDRRRATATSGRRWEDSKRAVQSRPTASRSREFPAG